LGFTLIVSCNKWESNTLNLNLTSKQAFNIENQEFTITVFGYDELVADVPASVIVEKKIRCTQIPCKVNIDLPDNAQKLIKYTTHKGNDRYYLAIEWDSDGDGKWDIGIDYDQKFNVDIYTSKRQTVYLTQIKDYRFKGLNPHQ
jgi:hypothetical protein